MDVSALGETRLSDEEQIADILDDVQKGMESKRVYKVLAHVSRRYHDAEGRDYQDIKEYVTRILKSYREIRITRTPPRILIDGNKARAIDTFATIAEPFDPMGSVPINLQGEVSIYLEKKDGDWQIVEWGRLHY